MIDHPGMGFNKLTSLCIYIGKLSEPGLRFLRQIDGCHNEVFSSEFKLTLRINLVVVVWIYKILYFPLDLHQLPFIFFVLRVQKVLCIAFFQLIFRDFRYYSLRTGLEFDLASVST